TVVRLVNGLERITSGQLLIDGVDVTKFSESQFEQLRREIGMIFQQFNLFNSRTVAGNVAFPLKVAKWPKADRDRRVAELLDFVGLLDRALSYPDQLSGGQKQRGRDRPGPGNLPKDPLGRRVHQCPGPGDHT
ncbi:MAG TPA: ATP-binding cassette domain-containing protein, partial [Kineosporiaceae bacterium]|nr:ATP-binding cassette domain-containing protein [Kineosporiaceae bacterium]